MENQILEILKNIQGDINNIKADISELKTEVSSMKDDIIELKVGQVRIEKKLDTVYDQTAELTEFRTEVNSKLDVLTEEYHTVEEVTKLNTYEIQKLKIIK